MLPLCAITLSACSSAEKEDSIKKPCVGKCDAANNTKVFTELDDKTDPAAEFLKTKVDQYGALDGDYRTLLTGIGEAMGCDASQQKTFTILLSNRTNFPRNIVTHCSDNPRKASTFFLSTQSDDGELKDINARDLKIASWDNDSDQYNLYELKAEDGPEGPLTVYVNPPQCMTCHGAAANLNAPDVAFLSLIHI